MNKLLFRTGGCGGVGEGGRVIATLRQLVHLPERHLFVHKLRKCNYHCLHHKASVPGNTRIDSAEAVHLTSLFTSAF